MPHLSAKMEQVGVCFKDYASDIMTLRESGEEESLTLRFLLHDPIAVYR